VLKSLCIKIHPTHRAKKEVEVEEEVEEGEEKEDKEEVVVEEEAG
jgi:hypothetical protein